MHPARRQNRLREAQLREGAPAPATRSDSASLRRPAGRSLCGTVVAATAPSRSQATVVASAHAAQSCALTSFQPACLLTVDVDLVVDEPHLPVAIGAGAQLRHPLGLGADVAGQVYEGQVVVEQIGEAVDLAVGRPAELLLAERAVSSATAFTAAGVMRSGPSGRRAGPRSRRRP